MEGLLGADNAGQIQKHMPAGWLCELCGIAQCVAMGEAVSSLARQRCMCMWDLIAGQLRMIAI
jgi:hypothetical protein